MDPNETRKGTFQLFILATIFERPKAAFLPKDEQ